MSQIPREDAAKGSLSTTEEARTRRRGGLPWWLWVVLAAVLVAVVILIAIPLVSGSRHGVTSSPTPSVSSSASPTSTPTNPPSTTSTPTPSSTAVDVGQGTFTSEMFGYMADTLNSQNTAVLSQGGTFSNPVHVLAANSGLNQNMNPDDAVNSMNSMFTPVDPNPWDLALSDSILHSFRSGPYGQYFPVGAIVAKSHDGHVFSFIGNGSTITTMFMAASDTLLR